MNRDRALTIVLLAAWAATAFVTTRAGWELPTRFLRACGVEIDTKFGEA